MIRERLWLVLFGSEIGVHADGCLFDRLEIPRIKPLRKWPEDLLVFGGESAARRFVRGALAKQDSLLLVSGSSGVRRSSQIVG